MNLLIGTTVGIVYGIVLYHVVMWFALRPERQAKAARETAQQAEAARNVDAYWADQKARGYPVPAAYSQTVGACGAKGCKNRKPHSHVVDLCKRIKEK